MPDFNIEIEGLEETLAALDRVPATVAKYAFAKALVAATIPVIQAVSSRVPVHTGDLKEHLMSDIGIYPDDVKGVALVGFGKKGNIARWVEFGHRLVGHEPQKKEIGNIPAKPFMRPAAAAAAEAAVQAFADALNEALLAQDTAA